MRRWCITAAVAAALALPPGLAAAQDGRGGKLDLGKREYMANCAVCHGPEGKGDGPFAEQITKPVSDLTDLRDANDRVFPFDRVYKIIKGEEPVAWHGTREMPIWGPTYRAEAQTMHPPFWPYDPESYVHGRILALTAYVYDLQAD
jgi:mono/diheme cytochrome c family protein